MPHRRAHFFGHYTSALIGGLLLLAFFSLLALDLVKSRRDEIERQEAQMLSLAEVLERHINDSIGKIDLVLWTVARDYPRLARLPDKKVQAELAAFLQQIPDSQSLRIGDADGLIRWSASGQAPVSVADRAYFQRLKQHPDAGLVVSEPIFARFTHNWVVTLSRRLQDPGGEFVGHVQAAINADRFSELFSRIVNHDGDMISLYDRDMRLVARSPKAENQLGRPLVGSRLQSLLAQGDNRGKYIAVSQVDGIERHYIYHASPQLPFVVLIGKTERDMLANWQIKLKLYATSALLLTAAFGWLLWSWQRNYRSVVETADALEDAYTDLARHANYVETHDALTSLPNRHSLAENLARAVADRQLAGGSLALLLIDLDHFKNINEGLGHSVGDKLLQQFADRLRQAAGERDTLVRQGGDEFALLLADWEFESIPAHRAQRILEVLEQPFLVDGHELHVTCSIGIGVYPHDGTTLEALMQHADAALYEAKAAGRNTYRFFKPEMNERIGERVHLESRLRKALAGNQLKLHYQPQYRLRDGSLIGVEALLRWHDPEEGGIAPSRFIPIAEESGLIKPIGAWVLAEACRQAAEWQQRGLPPVVVAINLSAVQLDAPDIVANVRAALEENRLAPQWLELEITESMLMTDTERTIDVLAEFRRMGVKVAVDDFGTGYSSFAYLKHLPLDKIKIDQSFVRDIAADAGSGAIVQAIIAVAGKLGLAAIAEGVESEEQLELLRRYGCDEVQGFYYSPAIAPEEMAARLQTQAASVA